MTADDAVWHKIAARVGCHPWEARRVTSATGFWRWVEAFDREMNERKPEMWYSAQLASALHCLPFWVWGKPPPEEFPKVDTWLLKFTDGSDRPEEREKTEEELREEATIKSKASGWGMILMQRPPGESKKTLTLPPGVVDASQIGQQGVPAAVKPPEPPFPPPESPPKPPQTPRKRVRVDIPPRQ